MNWFERPKSLFTEPQMNWFERHKGMFTVPQMNWFECPKGVFIEQRQTGLIVLKLHLHRRKELVSIVLKCIYKAHTKWFGRTKSVFT